MRSLPLYLVALSRTISVGIATATQQPLYLSAFNAIPRVSSLFSTTKNHDEARMDGRIQAKDLLSSHFGPYGWPGQSFDYVIVGGGTAGLAMAKRLSEDNANSVAVIEAGGFYEIEGGNMTEVPMYLFNYFFDNGHVKNPLFDWYQYTVPQPVCTPCLWTFRGTGELTHHCRVSPKEPCFTCRERH